MKVPPSATKKDNPSQVFSSNF